ncbi:MAG: hypothetical protein MMC33_006197 [Icmadophila ericetorum]|nr:hypothetical protein [Icmadophila ericetorum]
MAPSHVSTLAGTKSSPKDPLYYHPLGLFFKSKRMPSTPSKRLKAQTIITPSHGRYLASHTPKSVSPHGAKVFKKRAKNRVSPFSSEAMRKIVEYQHHRYIHVVHDPKTPEKSKDSSSSNEASSSVAPKSVSTTASTPENNKKRGTPSPLNLSSTLPGDSFTDRDKSPTPPHHLLTAPSSPALPTPDFLPSEFLISQLHKCGNFDLFAKSSGRPYCPKGNECDDAHIYKGQFYIFPAGYDGEAEMDAYVANELKAGGLVSPIGGIHGAGPSGAIVGNTGGGMADKGEKDVGVGLVGDENGMCANCSCPMICSEYCWYKHDMGGEKQQYSPAGYDSGYESGTEY